jgi:WD40 repeat protein
LHAFEHQSVREIAVDHATVRALTLDSEGHVAVWDGTTGKALPAAHAPKKTTRVSLAGDGSLAAADDTKRTVVVWETATGKLRATLQVASEPVLRLSPRGRFLLSTSEEGDLQLTDLSDHESGPDASRPLLGSRTRIGAVAFSSGEELVVAVDSDGQARVWTTAGGVPIDAVGPGGEETRFVAFDSDQTLMAAGTNRWSVWRFEAGRVTAPEVHRVFAVLSAAE